MPRRGSRVGLEQTERQKHYLRLCLCDVNVVLLIVVVQADAISSREAGEAPQRHLQHCFWIANVQEILRGVQKTLFGAFLSELSSLYCEHALVTHNGQAEYIKAWQ